MGHIILLAVGGNSLIRAGQKGTIEEQFHNARTTADHVADLIEQGFHVVISHGNGPQVGSQLLRSEAGAMQTYTMPLDVCVASTQGEIGYILQNTLQEALEARALSSRVVTIVTQVLVDADDPAFRSPTKPIGPFYTKEAADRKQRELGWDIVEDAARGYRRVVPSPLPRRVIEAEIISQLVRDRFTVIAGGGGGIPVVRTNGGFKGIEAVIDKDRSSALLAAEVRAEQFIISTDVEKVCVNYKLPDERRLSNVTTSEMKRYLAEGHFAPGSMRPKIEAALVFLEGGGKECIITDPLHLGEAMRGTAGTHITADAS